MFDILARITEERMRRGWSEYQLAQNSCIPQSTISTWYRKQMQPSISSLEKICQGLGISLAEFFSTETARTARMLSDEQQNFLDEWEKLDTDEREAVLFLMKTMNRR